MGKININIILIITNKISKSHRQKKYHKMKKVDRGKKENHAPNLKEFHRKNLNRIVCKISGLIFFFSPFKFYVY